MILWLGITLFVTLSRFLTYRYLFRHTFWQGAAGDIPGPPWRYAFRMLLPEVSTLFTAGWSAPWRFMRRFELLLDGATITGLTVRFEGSSRKLYRYFAVAWVSIVVLITLLNVVGSSLDAESTLFAVQLVAIGVIFFVALVLVMAYYNSKLFAHVAESITIDGVALRFHARAADLVILYFTNLMMNVLSAGLSYYYSRMRIARFIVRHLEIRGEFSVGDDMSALVCGFSRSTQHTVQSVRQAIHSRASFWAAHSSHEPQH